MAELEMAELELGELVLGYREMTEQNILRWLILLSIL